MYHPPRRADSNNLEFVEIFNSQPWPEDLSGYQLAGAVQFSFPPGTTLAGEGLLVVAADPSAVRNVYGITNVTGPFAGRLQNSAERLRLLNANGAVLVDVTYGSDPPWPASADGAGHSLVLSRPSWGEGHPNAWTASDLIGGSPGRWETGGPEPLREVMFNELLAHTVDPDLDFLELYNHGPQAASLAGCHLTDDPATNKFTFPPAASVEARGFVALDQTQLGFRLSAAGETVYLINSNSTRVLDAIRFGGQARGVAFGRTPDGSPSWRPLAVRTPGQPNGPAQPPEVIINEIMCAPLSRVSDDQYVELYNRSTNTVDVGQWRFIDGIDFTFPAHTLMAPGAYLAVARNAGRLLTNYPSLGSSNLIGNFQGHLAANGEHLALARPELLLSTNLQGRVETNLSLIVVDEVTYGVGGRWPRWADHGGSSLERVDPRADGRAPDQWAESDETAKSDWTTVEFTGRLDNGDGSSPNSLLILLMGPGECLVDDVEVLGATGPNLLANPSFESGLSPWTVQGDHETSFVQPNGGIGDSRCLHVRAGGDGEPGANRIRVPLTSALAANANGTLRAKVRWLRGHPEILLRLGGNYLEAFGTLSVPTNLGTPGAPNSQALANAGPSIGDVQHQPILPAARQAVVVTARVLDPDGLSQVVLRYRLDPDTNAVTIVPMLDDGSGGDAVAGDGVYSASIPGQDAGRLVAFHVRATDAAAAPAARTFPSDAPIRECLVRFGEPVPIGKFGAYRIWITQATSNQWTTRLKLSNAGLDATFVNGSHRVIYNAGALYSGSAYHASRYTSPTGVACDYNIGFPPDDPFLGSEGVNVLWPGLTGGDPVDGTAQEEVTSYWLGGRLGLPFNYQRHVHFYVNGVHRSFIMEDTQKPDADLLRQWYPDDADGELFKIQIWREYDAAGNNTTSAGASLANFTTTGGVKKTARYRWAWTPRAAGGTMNDFQQLFALVDAVNAPANNYTASVEGTLDVEQWMRTFASEHIVGNWDSYGYGNGQNMYAYKPEGDRWKLMRWDIDVCLGNASDPANADLFKLTNPYFPNYNGDTTIVSRMYQQPAFARAYWRAVQDAVNGPLLPANLNPLLDARAAAFTTSGIGVSAPDNIKTYLSTRRDYCLSRLAGVSAGFTVTTPMDLTTNRNLVLLSGTAPVEVRDLLINGLPVPVTWTSVTSWVATAVLAPGFNSLVVEGRDRLGHTLPMASTNRVNYSGPDAAPEGAVVLNEIMYHPAVPGGAYVELFNADRNSAFDLSQWRLNGLDFTFPAGTILAAGQYLVLAEDRGVFAATYGSGVPVFAEFHGHLQTNGETLTLFRPGPAPDQELVVDRVRYEAGPPWPSAANGRGAALQLIDPAQDRTRVNNWSDRPRWKFYQFTGTPGANATNLVLYLDAAGEVFLDDVSLVPGSVAEAGSNLIANGDFESALAGTWQATANHAGSSASSAVAHRGHGSLRLIATGPGSPSASCAQAVGGVNPAGVYTLSFWYLPASNIPGLQFVLTAGFRSTNTIPIRLAPFTPGAANTLAGTPPAAPAVWLNEVQPLNLTGPADAAGHREPWLELHNPGTEPISLAGLFLTDDYSQLTKWAFPAGASLGPGEFKVVWADNAPAETSSGQWHTTFRINPTAGAVALAQTNETGADVIDYLNYHSIAADQSFGSIPDGQAVSRRLFFHATPGLSNAGSVRPINVVFNEWLASNVQPGGFPNPVGGGYDDWFELYNPGPEAADLAGYSLTDDLANPFQFVIPAGYTISPGDYLLVWADGQPSRNGTNEADLHVNFQLAKSGEALGLFAPDGSPINTVIFGTQTNNISQGRYPDGAADFRFMSAPSPRSANTLVGQNSSPAFTGFSLLPNGQLALVWGTVAGKSYRVEYKDNLGDAEWRALGGDYLAGDTTLTVVDPVVTGGQRFYRILKLD